MPKAKLAPKKKNAKSAVGKVVRNRRSPFELLQDLKAKRLDLAEKSEKKLEQMDSKIEALEGKYKQRIRVEELKASMNPEELEKEIMELKEKQKLLRLAMKQK